MTKPTTPLPNVVLAALEVLSDHIQARAERIVELEAERDFQISQRWADQEAREKAEARITKALAAKDAEIAQRKKAGKWADEKISELRTRAEAVEARAPRLTGVTEKQSEALKYADKILQDNGCNYAASILRAAFPEVEQGGGG
jgi:DNA repair exonuclease SbcCD ATPase subunit